MTVSFDLEALRNILRACAGEPDGIDLASDIGEMTFEDLGYDSIALMETAASVEREFGIAIADDDLVDIETPTAFVDWVRDRLDRTAVVAGESR
ncbi:actinorhodin polyketide synthase [Nocardia sp. ET3-3]|uniref:Actinorhodin polyketide synthase n=1 Tax=Nocardia terrae TaxID=2675851 RepID=A0A7K1V3W5_9NOCA|nr:acyl carrier protein [Nocardia terrae]MVU81323.1 actinorhodin polyketide synthase [Nocardia terrae]